MTNIYDSRRAKSSEWDRDVLANNVQDLRWETLITMSGYLKYLYRMTVLRMTSHQTLTGFHHLGLSSSNMQTLDKRISASTDQLDCIRGESG